MKLETGSAEGPPPDKPGFVWRSTRASLLRLSISAAFFAAAVYLIYRQVSTISPTAFAQALISTSPWAVVGSVALTAMSYLCLAGTEWLSLRALGHPLGYRTAVRVAIPCYALTNSAGFSPATGTIMRMRLYAREGLSAMKSAKVAMLAGAAVTVSGVVATGLAMLARPGPFAHAVHAPPLAAMAVGAAMAAPAAAWFLAFRPGGPVWFGRPSHLSISARAAGLAAGIGDWAFSCAALFVLLPQPHWAIFPGFFGAYVAGSVLSAATGVPGGIGVFEAIVLVLTSLIARAHETAAALLLYRCLYSLGPLALVSGYSVLRRVRARLGRLRP